MGRPLGIREATISTRTHCCNVRGKRKMERRGHILYCVLGWFCISAAPVSATPVSYDRPMASAINAIIEVRVWCGSGAEDWFEMAGGFPFDPDATEGVREAQIRVWEEWWEEQN